MITQFNSNQDKRAWALSASIPVTKLEVKKGPKIGSILGKKIGMCSVYDADKNHVELWTDFEGSGWKKQVEGDNIDGFNPKAKEFEAQLRIDGWKDEPKIDTAVVQEIELTTITADLCVVLFWTTYRKCWTK